ncbi:MAG: 4Fe-4S dicluster domain-containing protein [Candidatus Subteraquimicrobiales bacterium]|nr:4Fe-4S dicluster domain-containing protein [Candidatus Subteraquimicrobiales bacterium]
MAYGLLIDTSRCTACRGCQVACKAWNQLPAEKTEFTGSVENPPANSGETWLRVTYNEISDGNGGVKWLFGQDRCMHCIEPSCANVCAAGAIKKLDNGAVRIDQDVCIGCKNCHYACPFFGGVPRFRGEITEEEKALEEKGQIGGKRLAGTVYKCWMCQDRIENGLQPACATACSNGAIQFGEREELLAKAEERIAALQAAGETKALVYNPKGVGGTGTIFVLTDDPEVYGLPKDPQVSTGDMVAKWLTGLITAGVLTIVPFWMVFKAAEAEGKGGK